MKLRKLITICVIALIAIIVVVNCFAIVGPTERGLIVTMGKPSTEVLSPGAHLKLPFFQTLETWDLTPIEYEKTFPVGVDGALSKDQQTLGIRFVLYWTYDEDRIYEAATKYKTEDSVYQPLSSAIKSALKNEVGKWSVEEIISNQSIVQNNVRTAAENDPDVVKLPIIIQSFKIGDWDWTEDYDAMIKKTMARKQEVEQMKQEVALAEQEAQKEVKKAEALRDAQVLTSEAARIKAEGDAAAIKANAEGAAEAARLKAEGEAAAMKALADAELYEAQQIQKAASMKQAQWAHEEAMAELEAWNGKKVSDVMVMTPSGTLTTVTGK